MSIATRWCFTINNPTDADKFWEQPAISDMLQYLVLQEERGEQEGTLHWQGFLILKKREKMSYLKNWNQRAHWEVARGTNEQAKQYCRKDETYTGGLRVEIGEIPQRAKAKKAAERLEAAAEELDIIKDAYKRPREIDSYCLLQPGFIGAYKELTTDILGPYRPSLKIITLVGPPGTGKSFAINTLCPGHGLCIMGNNGVWFQNPLADVMVFEEFVGQIQLQRMLRFLDPYPLSLEVKGGMRPAMYTKVILTSNIKPTEWYKGADQEGIVPAKRKAQLNALYDRLGVATDDFEPARTCGIYIECPEDYDDLADARQSFHDLLERALSE